LPQNIFLLLSIRKKYLSIFEVADGNSAEEGVEKVSSFYALLEAKRFITSAVKWLEEQKSPNPLLDGFKCLQ
jgi:hypothetical protein